MANTNVASAYPNTNNHNRTIRILGVVGVTFAVGFGLGNWKSLESDARTQWKAPSNNFVTTGGLRNKKNARGGYYYEYPGVELNTGTDSIERASLVLPASSPSSSTILATLKSDKAHLWNANTPLYKLSSYGGYGSHSRRVDQPFPKELLNELFGREGQMFDNQEKPNRQLKNARKWFQVERNVWCGTRDDVDGFYVPLLPRQEGAATIPYACPSNARARAYIEQGFSQRFAFNDNEAICSFQAAIKLDPHCPLAHLGQAIAMGPNVNFAQVANAKMYRDILASLVAAEETLIWLKGQQTKTSVLEQVHVKVSTVVLDALRRRYLPQALQGEKEKTRGRILLSRTLQQPKNESEAAPLGAKLEEKSTSATRRVTSLSELSSKATLDEFHQEFSSLNADYLSTLLVSHEAHPEDDLIAILTVGALMQNPSWKWWMAGSDYRRSQAFENHNHHEHPDDERPYVANGKSPILSVSKHIHSNNARANHILSNMLTRTPEHLGANHYYIHSTEGGPHPQWALHAAFTLQRVDPYNGHSQHMPSHIYQRLGMWKEGIYWNKRANGMDFAWAANRAGGSFMSPLYPYEGHNVAFQIEAAMHMGNFQELASAIAVLYRLNSFRAAAAVSEEGDGVGAWLVGTLARSLLYPLRFGLHQEILRDMDWSFVDNEGQCEYEPGKFLTSQVALRARRHALAVAAARMGWIDVAESSIAALLKDLLNDVTPADMNNNGGRAPFCLEAKEDCVNGACTYFLDRWETAKAETLRANEEDATGSATVNNADPLRCLDVRVPYAELALAQISLEHGAKHLEQAWHTQQEMQYDEPSPFYYPIVATLGKVKLHQGKYAEAVQLFRDGLFTWPNSIYLMVGLKEGLMRMGEGWEEVLVASHLFPQGDGGGHGGVGVFDFNDTVIELEWL